VITANPKKTTSYRKGRRGREGKTKTEYEPPRRHDAKETRRKIENEIKKPGTI